MYAITVDGIASVDSAVVIIIGRVKRILSTSHLAPSATSLQSSTYAY